jgi:hypothetical protein
MFDSSVVLTKEVAFAKAKVFLKSVEEPNVTTDLFRIGSGLIGFNCWCGKTNDRLQVFFPIKEDEILHVKTEYVEDRLAMMALYDQQPEMIGKDLPLNEVALYSSTNPGKSYRVQLTLIQSSNTVNTLLENISKTNNVRYVDALFQEFSEAVFGFKNDIKKDKTQPVSEEREEYDISNIRTLVIEDRVSLVYHIDLIPKDAKVYNCVNKKRPWENTVLIKPAIGVPICYILSNNFGMSLPSALVLAKYCTEKKKYAVDLP